MGAPTKIAKADMMFRQALSKEAKGDMAGADRWLAKAAEQEITAFREEPTESRDAVRRLSA